MKDYRAYSFWLETCGDDLTPRPPLDGSIEVDVAIMGAGFTGLWTAYKLLRRDPSLSVAVIEKEIAGFGASGRNGGWCFSGFPVSPRELTRRYDAESARAVSLAMFDSVDDVGRVCTEEDIDAHYARGGEREIARAYYDLPQLREMWAEFDAIGLGDQMQVLDAEQTAARIRVNGAVGSFFNPHGAAVQPARLARGLAHAVERHGGRIYEQTAVTGYQPGPNPKLLTGRGEVRARRAVVLAGEAYLASLPGMGRAIIPLTSHIVVTEPLSPDIWEQIGWEDRAVMGGFGTHGGYLQRTADGRIAFGPYRGVYPYGSRITDALDRQEAIFEHARRSARLWFPALAGVRFTHAWGGVFGMPRDRMPTMSFDPRSGIAMAFGYTGEGVATANLSGRVLADAIAEVDSDLLHLPMTRHQPRPWEPEPARWTGVTFVRRERDKQLRLVERTGRYPERKSLAQRFYNW
ncbi:MAG: FAD-dependent oxidoreductase [Thermomicrobiales bacterium]|nr:FAD-dependent oxidoreductase [Thermomicrobiales bacterium]